jgi:NADPH2:quinone reductase
MRAFAISGFGEPGSVQELPVPDPEQGEILVRLRAAGVNAVDPWVTRGAMKEMMEHRFPLIPGVEGSGVVKALGRGVEGYAVGDEVYGVAAKPFFGAGTFAQFVALPKAAVARKPSSIDHLGAAALPHTALTALVALETVDPKEGQVLLLVGATGGVGSYLTQLAAQRGSRVVAVARGENAQYARELGAAETIDYSKGDLVELVRERYPNGVDALADFFHDAPGLTRLSDVIRPGGIVVSASGAADGEVLAKKGFRAANVSRADPGRLPELAVIVDEGRLKLPAITSYPLEKADVALQEIEAGHVRGKLVLKVD